MTWDIAAIRLARAILRYEKDDYRLHHTESTIRFAQQVLKKEKLRKERQ
jgi:hypothetical protein